jgi:hypothetical protein
MSQNPKMASTKRGSSRSSKKGSAGQQSPASSMLLPSQGAESPSTPGDKSLSALSTSPSSLLDTPPPPEDASSLLQSIISLLGSDPLKQVQRLVKYESKFAGACVIWIGF